MDEAKPAVLILAAGKGTRMKSQTPKVLHKVMGHTLLERVLNAARYLAPAKTVVVTGHGADEVESFINSRQNAEPESAGEHLPPKIKPVFARQEQQLGTGHAVSMAKEVLSGHDGPLMILSGDVPLISPQTLMDFLAAHKALQAALSVLTVTLDDPANYGRIIRDQGGWLEAIVEAKDASPEQKLIQEINSGFYVGDCRLIFEAIERLTPNNAQKEYYLTDVAADFRAGGHKVAAIGSPDPLEVQGVNDRLELAMCQEVLRNRTNTAWMRSGVTMQNPESIYIEPGVKLAADVTLGQGVVMTGHTTVAEQAEIGPYCIIESCRLGAGAKIGAHCILTGAEVMHGESVPPLSVKDSGTK